MHSCSDPNSSFPTTQLLALRLMARLPVRGLARLEAVVAPLAPAALVQGGAVCLQLAGTARRGALHVRAAGGRAS